MTYHQSARPAARHRPAAILAAAAVLSAVLLGVLAHQSLASPARPPWTGGALDDQLDVSEVTLIDGAVPDGVTVFDDEVSAVVHLDVDLLAALRHAATDAMGDGVEFVVNSGWRSPKYQDQLLHEAVVEYGSEAEAARWVATPSTSAHVLGDAVDIGPSDATAWLSTNGAGYGLCQIYGNEPWHYQLFPDAVDHGCPPLYADPTQDPRMQQ